MEKEIVIKYKAILIASIAVINCYALYIGDINLQKMAVMWCGGFMTGNMR